MSLKISRLEQILNFIGPLCKAVKKCLEMVYIGAYTAGTILIRGKPFYLALVVNVLPTIIVRFWIKVVLKSTKFK